MSIITSSTFARFCFKVTFHLPLLFVETGLALRFLTVFSVPANTKFLLAVNRDENSDAYAYRFFHGIRVISIFMVVLGHSYSAFDFANTCKYGKK